MASPNLDLVRSICAAWERGDYSSAQWAHPEIEFVLTGGPEDGSWKGLVGMAEAWRDFLSAWEEFHQEADEYLELDDERVLVLFRRSGRGKTSGFEVEETRSRGAGLFHVSAGKVTRFVGYWDRERAFAELGLAPETRPPRSSGSLTRENEHGVTGDSCLSSAAGVSALIADLQQ